MNIIEKLDSFGDFVAHHFMAILIVSGIIGATFTGLIAYVIIHFIAKYW